MTKLRLGMIMLVGIFLICREAIGLSLAVPDGVVHTDLRRNLIIDSRGILTCRFNRDPIAVYWLKGHSVDDAPIQIVWHGGAKYGPKYKDGSYDMDSNYSLIIKNVDESEKGRYICQVSNHQGILINNYTDVTLSYDGVETKPNVNLETGMSGVIPCKLNVKPRVVSWKTISTNSSKILITVDPNHGMMIRPGFEGRFNITTDYSLFMTNVNIEDEGQYLCEVQEEYTYTTFKNISKLSVFALPISPFPVIDGCLADEDQNNCIFTVTSAVTITCLANKYYPDIGLLFQHCSKNIETLKIQTWNNTDGTRNKSVSIVGDISKEVYTCTAFNIPGLDGNLSRSVRIIGQNKLPNPVAIAVPLFLTTGIAIGLLTLTVYYRRRMTSNEKDPVSHVELWKLVEYAFRHKETTYLDNAVADLCNFEHDNSGVIKDADYYYSHLCKWKAKTRKIRQRSILAEKLYEMNLERTLKDLRDYRDVKSTEIEWFDLKHILMEIGEREKMTKFLESLGIDHSNIRGNAETTQKTFIQQAADTLQKWTVEYHSINPVIILNTTLEKLNHESANKFFLVPADKKQDLGESEWKLYIRGFSRKHVDMLSTIIPNDRGDNKPLQMKFLRKNCEVLFNTENMLLDWWKEQQCSYFRRRWMLDDALIVQTVEAKLMKGAKPKSSHACPDMEKLSKNELCKIVDYLSPKSRNDVFGCLGIPTNVPEHADGYQIDWIANALWDWRLSNEGEVMKMNDILLSALRHTRVSMKLEDLESIHPKDNEVSTNDGWLWPSDNELKLLAHYIDTEYTAHVREHLKLTNFSETANRNYLFDALCDWRQSDKEDFIAKYEELISALNGTNISGLLLPMRMDDIHKAEYVEIAFNLLMTDVLPVAKHLGIDEKKFPQFRPAFDPSHLQEGTIGLVSNLITSLDKNKQREDLCKRLIDRGFPPSIQLQVVAFQMSFGELSSIFNALITSETSAQEEEKHPQQEPKEGDHLLPSKEIASAELTRVTLGTKAKRSTEFKRFKQIKNMLPRTTSKDRPSTTEEQSKPQEGDAFLEEMTDTETPMKQNAGEAEAPSPETKVTISSDAATLTIEKDDAESEEPPANTKVKTSATTMIARDPGVRKSEELSPHLNLIKKMLNLTDELVSSIREDNMDEFTLFWIWKGKIQLSALNERAAVIKCLQDSGKTEIARSVIKGKFIPDEISLPFIKHIVEMAKANSQLENLAAVLGLKKDYQESQESVDDMSEIIQKEFRRNRSQKNQNVESNVSNNSTEDRDDSISMEQDRILKLRVVSQAGKLVEHGFLDLACELLNIYHL